MPSCLSSYQRSIVLYLTFQPLKQDFLVRLLREKVAKKSWLPSVRSGFSLAPLSPRHTSPPRERMRSYAFVVPARAALMLEIEH